MKPWYTSRTLWANAVISIGGISAATGLDLGLTPEVQATIVAGILAVANVILRLLTKTGLTK